MTDKSPQVTEAVAAADVARIWAVMSHEIRTPLMGVVGMLEVLGRTSLTDEQRRIIATVEDSSGALMRIIDDVLDFAKLESALVNLDEAPTDPLTIVESTTELLAAIAPAKRLSFVCEAVGDVPLVMCDAMRLRQVLVNIGTNAVKHTDTGRVVLTVTAVHGDAANVRLRFSVADSGQGIPLELQGYLFEPFWQLAGRERSFGALGGVGLGLAICRTLIETMGGTIAVQSEPGQGTRFDVEIPFARARADAPALPSLKDTDVVAVDAGECALAVALRYLERTGAAVVRVDNLGALGRYVPQTQRKTVILLGGDAEVEDVDAVVAALGRMGSEGAFPVVWLHRAGSLPARPGIWPVRGNPLRRADLIEAVQRAGAPGERDGFSVVARHREPLVDPKAVIGAARESGLVILVAEDNRVNQEVLRQQLAILGYDCDIAPTGHAAFKALAENRYPLLLCDCHMPGMDGFELTRLIRESEKDGARMPIIAVTANAVPGEAMRCRAAGMDDYLAKPIEIGALQAKLNRWLGAAAPAPLVVSASAPAAAPPNRLLDLSSLAVVYGNDPARLMPIVTQWSAGMADGIKEIEAHMTARNWDAALAAAHRIKGSAGVAGAARISAAAGALEAALQGGDAGVIAREWARVQTLAETGIQEAAAWRAANDQAAVLERAASGARI